MSIYRLVPDCFKRFLIYHVKGLCLVMEITVSECDKYRAKDRVDEQSNRSVKPQERLLFVDDIQAILDGYKFIFESEGFTVDLATDSASMMKQIDENRYDLIVMDYHLRGEKGKDLINEIYQKNPNQKLVIISGQKDAEDELQRLSIPIAGFFLKPLTVEKLLDFIIMKLHETI